MRRALPLLLLLAGPAFADSPPLKAFADWQAGQWKAGMVGGRSRAPMCLALPETLLAGGRPQPGCVYTVIRDDADSAVVTYRCPGGRQGRTEVRRDAQNIYTVDAQGVADGLPFGDRAEWRRVGAC